MANLLAPVARQRTFTDLGVVAPGSLLYTLVSGTPNTPQPTTSDAAGLVPNTNPIVASAGGLFGPIYLTPNVAYHFRLTDAGGLPIWDQDPVTALDGANVTGNLTVGGTLLVTGPPPHAFVGAATGGYSVRVQNTLAGGGNAGALVVGSDADPNLAQLLAYSSIATPAGHIQPSGSVLYAGGAGGLSVLAAHASGAVRLYTAQLERARITPTGEVLIGASVNSTPPAKLLLVDTAAAYNLFVIQNTNGGNAGNYAAFLNTGGGPAGSIAQTGVSSVAYLTTSDARLKTDRGPATDLAALRALRVHDFAWTADGTPDRGIFAQEAHAHYPRAVTPGTDDRTDAGALAQPWMTDYSKFVADLIVGWQAHEAAIAELRATLAAHGRSRR